MRGVDTVEMGLVVADGMGKGVVTGGGGNGGGLVAVVVVAGNGSVRRGRRIEGFFVKKKKCKICI